jgi:hypothetical protein
MENSEAVWSDEQLSGARELLAPGPFVSEARTAALDEAVAVLERADRLDERATAALATLTGPAYVPIGPPMHVMGGGGFPVDVHNWWFEWPDHYFVPGDSQERWLGLVDCPPSQRYAAGSAVPGFPYAVGDPKTGRVASWAQPPRTGTNSGVASAGVYAFHRPTTSLAVLTLAPEIAWTFQSSYFVDWDWGRNFAITVQLGGSVGLTAWVWNPATNAWEQATNGLGGTPVSATRQVMTTTNSNVSGSKSDHVSTYSGHIDSGGFSARVLVEGGRTYAFGVHVNSWFKSSFVPVSPSTPPSEPPLGAVICWTSMTADVPRIWL